MGFDTCTPVWWPWSLCVLTEDISERRICPVDLGQNLSSPLAPSMWAVTGAEKFQSVTDQGQGQSHCRCDLVQPQPSRMLRGKK